MRFGTMKRLGPTLIAGLPLLALGPMLVGASVKTASAAERLRLSLAQAVDHALEANPEVRRAREQKVERRLQVREVRSRAFPKLDFLASYGHTRDPGLRNSPSFSDFAESGLFPPEALEPLSFDTFSYRFDLEQPLYTFGRVGKAIRAARYELEGVEADVRSVESRVAHDVALSYYDLLLAGERLGVLETERAARERQLKHVKDRLELEDATRLDLLSAQVALANLRPEILAAENALAVARVRLNETLGRPATEPVEPAGALALPDPLPEVPEAVELLEWAGATRPELLRFSLTRQVLEQAEGVTRADTLPEIKANASFGVSSFKVANLEDMSFRNWTVGVNLTWTLFDGFKTASAVGRLRSQRRQSQLEEEAFRARLARELEQAVGEWQRGLEAVRVSHLAVDLAREAERVTEESFRWGAATVLDILEAERAMRQADLTRVQAQHVAVTALADMKYLLGLRPDASLARGGGARP